MNNTDDDTSSPPSTAAQAAGEARKTAPWKRPAPIVGGRRGVAKRGSGIPRPGGQPKAAAPAPAPAPKPAPLAVVPAAAAPSSDPKRPWWKRRPPVVGGGKRPQKPMQTSPRAPAAPRQTFDDLVDDQIVAMDGSGEVTAPEPSEAPASDLESELDDLADLGDLA